MLLRAPVMICRVGGHFPFCAPVLFPGPQLAVSILAAATNLSAAHAAVPTGYSAAPDGAAVDATTALSWTTLAGGGLLVVVLWVSFLWIYCAPQVRCCCLAWVLLSAMAAAVWLGSCCLA